MRRDAANNFAPDAPDNYAPLGAERQSRSFDVLLRQSVRHSISIMKRVYDECVSVSIGGQCTSAALIGGPGSRCHSATQPEQSCTSACMLSIPVVPDDNGRRKFGWGRSDRCVCCIYELHSKMAKCFGDANAQLIGETRCFFFAVVVIM